MSTRRSGWRSCCTSDAECTRRRGRPGGSGSRPADAGGEGVTRLRPSADTRGGRVLPQSSGSGGARGGAVGGERGGIQGAAGERGSAGNRVAGNRGRARAG